MIKLLQCEQWCNFLPHSVLSALYAIARPSAVCLSHWWISRKRLKLEFWNFHRTVAPSL